MAASTWSHGSTSPPGNHGTAPHGSCAPAMLAAVAATSTVDSTPGSSGSDTVTLRLVRVQHETLADQRVEQALGAARQPRPGGDVPDQEPVVGAHGGRVAVYAGGALEPPVRRVQRVRVVAADRA